MRTFEQYIRESIDFRLGGSKNKGGVDKTFGELKKGDKFYNYYVKDLSNNHAKSGKNRRFDYEVRKAPAENKYGFADLDYTDSEGGESSFRIEKELLNHSTEIIKNGEGAHTYFEVFTTIKMTMDEVVEKVIEFKKMNKENVFENADFRLGGSKNKGAVDKTFGELKKGDVFYRYSIDISSRRFTKNPCRCIFEAIDGDKMYYFFDDRNSDIARFTMFVDKDKSKASYTYGVAAGHGLYYVYSTIEYDKATIIEKIVELSKKADKDGNVYEAVDFRLGGKNNVDSGNFAFSHLRLGDDVYCVNVDTRNCKVIEREQGEFERSKELHGRMFVYFLVNKRACTCPVPKEKYETSSVHIEPSPIYDNEAKIYSTYYVEDDEAIELAKEWNDGLKEAVDFRLGGSTDKGDLHKTFEELEKGDKIYLYKFDNFDVKSCHSDVFEFREKEAHTFNNSHFMHGRWESGGQPVISILDKNLEKDYFVEFIRGGSVFTRVYSTFEMTAEEALRIANEAWKMKYIREAVDFRLGGKANKGEVPKTFEELEKGDIVYMIETHKDGLVFRKKGKFYKINLDPADCYIVFKDRVGIAGGRSTVFPFDLDYINDVVCVINNVIYSTYEMSDAEAIKLAKSERKRKRK